MSDWNPPPPPDPYGQQPGYSYGGVRRTEGTATASLVLGIVGIIACPIICSVLAIIFGVQAKNKIRQDPSLQGEGMAQAGFILGIISLVLYGGLFIVAIILAASNNDSSSTSLGAVVHLLAV